MSVHCGDTLVASPLMQTMAVAAEPQILASLGNSQLATPPASSEDKAKPFQFFGRVTYASATDASMVRDTLAVDPELRPQQVLRILTVEDKDLVMRFKATDVRTLRAAVSTFCDLLALVTRTLEMFGADGEFAQPQATSLKYKAVQQSRPLLSCLSAVFSASIVVSAQSRPRPGDYRTGKSFSILNLDTGGVKLDFESTASRNEIHKLFKIVN
ncbi:hypothetical protein ABBQ32_011074 [Trebouxia sp. C0010 RCD-2024]